MGILWNRNNPKRVAYASHKHQAKMRGIDFLLSFDEWWEIWKPYWDVKKELNLCMCRPGDRGAYKASNVHIDTKAANGVEAHARLHTIRNPEGDLIQIYSMEDFCRASDLDPSHMIKVINGKRKSHKGYTL